MVSLRVLAVLSVVALLHCAPLAEDVPKCEKWAWLRNGNEPVKVYTDFERKEVKCSSGVCITTSVHYEDSRFIRSEANCFDGARPLAASYECEPPKFVGGSQRNTELRCFCKAGTDSACNRPELMFDPEGNDGQKSSWLELRKIGIIAEWKMNTPGQREIDLQYFTCEERKEEIRNSGNIVHKYNLAIPCKGACAIKITRIEPSGMDVISDCRASTDQTEPYTCTQGEDTIGKFVECLCVGSGCNKAYERPFDPEGDAGQKNRAAELRKIGIIAKIKITNGIGTVAIVADENFIKTTIEPTSDANTEADVPETTESGFNPNRGPLSPDDEEEETFAPDPECGPEQFRGECEMGKCTVHFAPLAEKYVPVCVCDKGYTGNRCQYYNDPNVFAAPENEKDEESSMSRTVASPALVAAVLSIVILWR